MDSLLKNTLNVTFPILLVVL